MLTVTPMVNGPAISAYYNSSETTSYNTGFNIHGGSIYIFNSLNFSAIDNFDSIHISGG
jgi:hypothetical protein